MPGSEQHVTPAIDNLLAERPRFLAFVHRHVADPATAEDLLQSAYVKCLEHASALRDADRAESWFFRILRNAIADHYRRSTAHDSAATAPDLDALSAPELSPHTPCRCTLRELSALRPAYQDALRIVELEEMPVQEFAAQQGIAPTNASVRLHRARKALRHRVAASCRACSGCFDCNCQ